MGLFGPSRRERLDRVKHLQLNDVRRRVMKDHGWDDAKAKEIEAEYRKFLMLFILYPGEVFGPRSEDIDHFWHAHILFTREYARDMEQALGFYLHHAPDTVVTEGATKHHRQDRTEQRYQEAFGRTRSDDAATQSMLYASCGSTLVESGQSHSSHGHAHDGGGSHGDGGGHSCGGHSCGGHSCGGHGCGGSCSGH